MPSAVIQRHGFRERNHSSLGGNVGRMVSLADQSHHAGCVQNASLTGSQSIEREPRGQIYALEIHSQQPVPLLFRSLMQGLGWAA